MRASLVLVVALGLVATALAGSRSLLHSRGAEDEVTHTEDELAEFFDIARRIDEEDAERASVQGSPDTRNAPYVSVQQHNRLVRWLGKKTKQLNSYSQK